MSLFMGRWFGVQKDIIERLIRTNEEKILLLEQSKNEKLKEKIANLKAENEELKNELKKRENN